MNLPESPGRARRLAYGNYIRNNRRNSDLSVIGRNIRIAQTVQEYNVDADIDIDEDTGTGTEKRLLIKDLLKKSSIYFKKDLFLCSICLDEKIDNIIRRLICDHNFHIECIENWLSDNTSCPICRYKLC